MATGAPIPMPIEPAGPGARAMPQEDAILTLAQWFSPAFPVGAFAYSHGLEAAAQAGDVHDAASLSAWIETVLHHGSGRSDALFLAAAYRAEDAAALAEIDAGCRAFAPARERLQETDWQGAAFTAAVAGLRGIDLPPLCYPVAAGRAARLCGLPQLLTAQFFLLAFASNLVAAGQRLAAVGQSEAQEIVQTLMPLCAEIARDTRDGDLSALSGSAFLADIAAMKHETQYSRIFRT